MAKPIVAITMGDAAGIGPEISCKSLLKKEVYEKCRPIVLGDARIIADIVKRCALPLTVNPVDDIEKGKYTHGTVDVLDYHDINMDEWQYGKLTANCGEAAVRYTMEACRLAMEKKIGAMVSAPLNKAAMRMAGYPYEGQTEIIGEMTKSENYGMFLLLGDMKILMYSNHMALEEACKKVRRAQVLKKIMLADEGLKFFPKKNPLIAVSALNPHCGEGGLFGRAELDEIAPAVEEAKKAGVNVVGPIPADTVFVQAKAGQYDLVIAMYHDQANIVMKLLGFGSVVTLLVGVPVIRTSTGHGTAFDIAGRNIANPDNLYEALIAAADLAQNRN